MSDHGPAHDNGPRVGFFRTILTEDDANKVWDPIRVQFVVGSIIATLALVVFIVLAMYSVLRQHHEFNYTDFGTGFAALLAGFGAYIGGTGTALFMYGKS